MGRRLKDGAYEPTQEEIAAACKIIQQDWSEREHLRRAGYPPEMIAADYRVPVDVRVESAREHNGSPIFTDLDL